MADKIKVNGAELATWMHILGSVSSAFAEAKTILDGVDTSGTWWNHFRAEGSMNLKDAGLCSRFRGKEAVSVISGILNTYEKNTKKLAAQLLKANILYEVTEMRIAGMCGSGIFGLLDRIFNHGPGACPSFDNVQGGSANGPQDGPHSYSYEESKEYLQYNLELEKMGKGDTYVENGLYIANKKDGFWGEINPFNSKIEGMVKAYESEDGALHVVIAIEGSKELADWINDADTDAVDGIHSGFRDSYERFVSDYINNPNVKINISGMNSIPDGSYTINELLHIISVTPGARLDLTGHSYGGAVAQCLTYYAISQYGLSPDKVVTYTYASPVPFTKEFVRNHPELQDANVYNIINIDDIVPDVGVTTGTQGNTSSVPTSFQEVWNTAVNKWNSLTESVDNAISGSEGGYNKAGSNIGTNYYYDTSESKGNIGTEHILKTYEKIVNGGQPDYSKSSSEIVNSSGGSSVHKGSSGNSHGGGGGHSGSVGRHRYGSGGGGGHSF